MVDIPYHTHQFDIPTASEGEIRTGVEAGKAITPDKLFPVLADKADKATTLAGYGIVDAATKEQGQKADTAVQPAQVSAVGFSGRYDDLLNKPSLGSASGLNVGTTAGTVAAGDDARIVNAAQQSITVTAGAGLSGGGTLAANIALALSSTSLASLALADTAVQPSRKLTAGTGLTGGGDFSADRTIALNAASIASLAKADTAVQPPAIANFATRAELTAGLGTKLDTGAQSADSAKLQGFTALTLPISTATQTALDGKATTVQGAKADTAVQPSDLGALATKSKVATTDIDATGSTAGGALLTRGGVWVDPSGGGDMFRATYDPNNKAADAFSMGSMVETTAAKVMTAAERTKLAGIATGATTNTGTVTSVGVAVPAGLSATGAITTSGTITISYATGYQGYTSAEANKLAGIPADADKTPALAAVATTGSYGDLSGKPATFPPSPHTHTPSEAGLGNVANKSEAQMVASGAIADALGGKVSFTAQTLSEAEAGQARANLGAGILSGFRNKIINGDFDIWQRATSQNTKGFNGADRWTLNYQGSSAVVQKWGNSNPVDESLPSRNFCKVTVNSVQNPAAFVTYNHYIERVTTVSGKVTVSFWAKADTPKKIGLTLYQLFGTGGSAPVYNIGETIFELTTTFKKYTVVITLPSIHGKIISHQENDIIGVSFWFDAGTDQGFLSGVGQKSAVISISRVSLVEGDATAEADPFSPRHIAQEMALCQRYFEKVDIIAWQSITAGVNNPSFIFQAKKRAAPTLLFTTTAGTGAAFVSLGDPTYGAYQSVGHSVNAFCTISADAEL